MPETVSATSPFVRQVSGKDAHKQQILSVLAKRSYRYDSSGACTLHEDPSPLREAIKTDDKTGELLHEFDLYPFKLRTDVVLHGKAGSADPVLGLTCAVRVGAYEKRILVTGNRRCALSRSGELLFSEPEPFTAIALSYANAYGGRDQAGHAALGNPFGGLVEFFKPALDVSNFSLCDYPRNPAGKGYLCHWDPAAFEALEMPNLEDPLDRLSPARLFAGNWDRWPAMPLPQGMGWVNMGWFPRSAYFGVPPLFDPGYAAVAEVARGQAPPDLMQPRKAGERPSLLAAQGASLGLQVPYLRGDEEIQLTNILPDIRAAIRLPGERPVIYVDGRNGKMLETRPVLHSLRIEPYFRRVSLVWRGCGAAIRPYAAEELKTMPLHVRWPGV
jgi:hypothetical protein